MNTTQRMQRKSRDETAAKPVASRLMATSRPAVTDAQVPLFLRGSCSADPSALPVLRKANCGCGTCASCAAAAGVQLSQASDPLEREADAIAERVMRSAVPGGASLGASPSQTAPAGPVAGALSDAGRGLDAATRAFMEPRFGAGFGSVRVHDGAEAAQRASAFAARAYTVGEHVVFGSSQYRPGSDSGRQLIAHELAHVVQHRQGRAGTVVQRTADPTKFSCTAGRAGAGADPFADLDSIDRQAQGLAESMEIFGIISSILNPATSTSAFGVAYQTRFGTPQPVGARFRNRFTGNTLATEEEAAQQEIDVIGTRFGRLRDFLAGSIRYKCRANGVNYTLGGCAGRCPTGRVAESCVPDDQRTIGICPAFWGLGGDNQRAGALIHEAAHMRLDFGGHGSASRAQRGRNPECYTSMVADTFGFAPFDLRCPPI